MVHAREGHSVPYCGSPRREVERATRAISMRGISRLSALTQLAPATGWLQAAERSTTGTPRVLVMAGGCGAAHGVWPADRVRRATW